MTSAVIAAGSLIPTAIHVLASMGGGWGRIIKADISTGDYCLS